jgi:hypothetical protein
MNEMQRVTIEYGYGMECKSATGQLMCYCTDGDVKIIDEKGKIRKGMPVQFHEEQALKAL